MAKRHHVYKTGDYYVTDFTYKLVRRGSLRTKLEPSRTSDLSKAYVATKGLLNGYENIRKRKILKLWPDAKIVEVKFTEI